MKAGAAMADDGCDEPNLPSLRRLRGLGGVLAGGLGTMFSFAGGSSLRLRGGVPGMRCDVAGASWTGPG